ncbi:hypothetical protein LOD99_6189 [Oopsacas minuta]|uniref:Uncharacterized protein n=1 Tax=Oopsacas minuta TaxID=111878 RepID=A0AAV7JN18_9METZ|nr:hypothetical protein LOD99_6189 [Oopsacas minuta]
MPFAIPRIWREPVNHHKDCYFCIVDITKYKGKRKDRKHIDYPNIPSSISPVSHKENLPIPISPFLEGIIEPAYISSSEEDYINFDEDLSWKPHFPNQQELNDLVRELGLTKSNAELLGSRLREWNLLDPSCKISIYRKRHHNFASFYKYSLSNSLCYCSDVVGLFNEIGVNTTLQIGVSSLIALQEV